MGCTEGTWLSRYLLLPQTLNIGNFFEETSKLFYTGAGFIRIAAHDELMTVTFHDYTGQELPDTKIEIHA